MEPEEEPELLSCLPGGPALQVATTWPKVEVLLSLTLALDIMDVFSFRPQSGGLSEAPKL